MSWLSKFLPSKSENVDNSIIPDGLWIKCEKCREIVYSHDFSTNMNICPKCDWHHYFSARDRINSLFGSNFKEINSHITTANPISFADEKTYSERIVQAQNKAKENEALITVEGSLNAQQKIALAVFEFKFIGGSMGSVVGEKFVLTVKHAVKKRIPFVCISTSGGARMQEGLFSLMQMAKTNASLHLLNNHKIPFVSLISNPTMGGVSASFVFLGDIVFAEPSAMIGFAGPRVIEQTIRESLPDQFQTSEFLLEKGGIDSIVDRRNFKATLIKSLDLLSQNSVNSNASKAL